MINPGNGQAGAIAEFKCGFVSHEQATSARVKRQDRSVQGIGIENVGNPLIEPNTCQIDRIRADVGQFDEFKIVFFDGWQGCQFRGAGRSRVVVEFREGQGKRSRRIVDQEKRLVESGPLAVVIGASLDDGGVIDGNRGGIELNIGGVAAPPGKRGSVLLMV